MNRSFASPLLAVLLCLFAAFSARAQFTTNNFFNWETPAVHPVAMSPDGSKLAVCNLAYDHLELFDITSGLPISIASVPVGINPVSVCFRSTNELWVANFISSTISVIDVSTKRVFNTINTAYQPYDVVFAGTPQQAYVSCGQPNLVQVFDPGTSGLVTNLSIDGNRPRSLAVSPDGGTVYVAIFESGNASTIIGSGIGRLTGALPTNAVTLAAAPSHGKDPPPNSGTNFVPAINPANTQAAPVVSLIVKKNSTGRWMDDNNGDWTDYISGPNSALTRRVPGWDMPDHDLAVINTTNLSITYASGLMNICMAVAVNPANGKISVVGTEALNSIRFTPVLNGIFVRVEMAQVDPATLTNQVFDLNPHLNYQSSQTNNTERQKSIGDPRGIVWSSDGSRGYVTGMGSDNLIVIDAQGNRIGLAPTVNLGQGPTGLALDESHNRLYIYNRFGGSISTLDTISQTLVATQPLFDPTPQVIKVGRPHLYNTHQTSGLGQVSCAACHVDARMDRLAWDLGDPTDVTEIIDATFNFSAQTQATNSLNFHPMKGPMVTLTFQDIISHEPFHWRGDREGIEAFSPTFTNLQGAPVTLTTTEMAEFKAFLGTIRFGPNPLRLIDNSFSTNVPIPGHYALGSNTLPAGVQLPNGNAQAGLVIFRDQCINQGCLPCHTLPTGLGTDMKFIASKWQQLAVSTNNSHHIASIKAPRSLGLPLRIPQLRNLGDKTGMDLSRTNSRSGFGFSHDGSVDSLVRFIQNGFLITRDQDTADLIALLLSFTGSDYPPGITNNLRFPPGVPSLDTPAGVGRQITISNTNSVALITTMIALTATGTNRVELIVKGVLNGVTRGWLYNPTNSQFISDRPGETYTANALRALAAVGSEQTYTLVPQGLGRRMSIDHDLDGHLDGELLLRPLSFTASGTSINFTSVPGLNYQLQYKTSLTDSNWTAIPGTIPGTGYDCSLADTSPPANTPRFYRVVAGP